MEQIIPTVGILRVGIYQIGLVLRVHLLFVVDSRNILLQLLLRITITSVIFGYRNVRYTKPYRLVLCGSRAYRVYSHRE